jgi:hypothetical protein
VNPYVTPIPRLPWTGLISERLFCAQLAFHVKPTESTPHELGVLVDGPYVAGLLGFGARVF